MRAGGDFAGAYTRWDPGVEKWLLNVAVWVCSAKSLLEQRTKVGGGTKSSHPLS